MTDDKKQGGKKVLLGIFIITIILFFGTTFISGQSIVSSTIWSIFRAVSNVDMGNWSIYNATTINATGGMYVGENSVCIENENCTIDILTFNTLNGTVGGGGNYTLNVSDGHINISINNDEIFYIRGSDNVSVSASGNQVVIEINNSIVGGGGGDNSTWNQSAANELYLLLDTANDPLTNDLDMGNNTITNVSRIEYIDDALTILTGVSEDGTNTTFRIIDVLSNFPNMIIKTIVPEKASVIVGSLIISNQDSVLNTINATLCKAHADIGEYELKVDCNSTSPTFTGTGADLIIEGDTQINQELWIRDSGGEWHFMSRELNLRDELFLNITLSGLNGTYDLSSSNLTITTLTGENIVVNIDKNETILDRNLDSIILNAGTNASPTLNQVFYKADGSPVLDSSSTLSINRPSVATFLLGANFTYASAIGLATGNNLIGGLYNRFLKSGSTYNSGFDFNVTTAEVNITTGIIDFLLSTVNIINNHSTSEFYVHIHSDGSFDQHLTLDDCSNYNDGSAISNNKYFNAIFGIAITHDGKGVMYAVTQDKPSTEYTKAIDAEVDTENTINFFPPDDIVSLVFVPVVRIVIRRSGGVNTIQTLSNGLLFDDLRGTVTKTSSSPPPSGITSHSDLSNLQPWESTGHENVSSRYINELPTACNTGEAFITLGTNNLSEASCGIINSTTTGHWNASDTDVFLADINKDVGIGTSTPNEKLVVRGNIKIDENEGRLRFFPFNSDRGVDFTFDVDIFTLSWNQMEVEFHISMPTFLDSELIVDHTAAEAFVVRKNNGGEDVLVVDTNNANVGIGTPTPTSKLHVIGGANITGDLSVGKNITLRNEERISNDVDNSILFTGTNSVGGGAESWVEFDFDAKTWPTWRAFRTAFPTTSLMYFDLTAIFNDNKLFSFGTSQDSQFKWSTVGNDHFEFGTNVGTAARSGHFWMIANDAGKKPVADLPIVDHVTLRLQGSSTNMADYIEMFHNTSDGIIQTGKGNLILNSSTGNISLRSPDNTLWNCGVNDAGSFSCS